MPRLLLVLTGVLALPVLAATPAYAVDNVICVNMPAGTTCGATAASIPAALSAAGSNGLDNTILVGAGTYVDGPYVLNAAAHSLTLKGSGEASTTLTFAASASSQPYLSASSARVQDLTILMAPGADSANDTGLFLSNGATVDHVTVIGTGTADAYGARSGSSQISHSTIQMPPTPDSRSIYVEGGNTVTDSVLSGSVSQSSPNMTDTFSRVKIRSDYQGVATDSGIVDIDDAVIDLGTSSGTGLMAANFNNGTAAKTINANHVTIVGGSAGSKGAWAYAAAPGAKQTATLTLSNSIVRGPATSLVAQAGNSLAVDPGNVSTATLTVSHSDHQGVTGANGPNGAGGVVVGAGNLVDIDPAFADAGSGDYRLTPGSPVVDQGSPAAGGPALDLDGSTRVVDGDGVLGAVRDMGAYELADSTPPATTITAGPTGRTRDPTPTFAFSSEPGATFGCRVDVAAYAACASPFTAASLGQGAHTFSVRATDVSANVDPTPATRAFTVDTIGPTTTLKKKPGKVVIGALVKFSFKASEPGSTFRCSIDGGKLKACKARSKFQVAVGKHKVKVFATDPLGNKGKTVKYSFTRIKPCSGDC